MSQFDKTRLSKQPAFVGADGTQYWPIFLNQEINGEPGNYIIKNEAIETPGIKTVQLIQPVRTNYGGQRAMLANLTGHGVAAGANALPSLRTILQVFSEDTTLEEILQAVEMLNAKQGVIQRHLRYNAWIDVSFQTALTYAVNRAIEDGMDKREAVLSSYDRLIKKQRVALMEDGLPVLDDDGEIMYQNHGTETDPKWVYRRYTLCMSTVLDVNETSRNELIDMDDVMSIIAGGVAAEDLVAAQAGEKQGKF